MGKPAAETLRLSDAAAMTYERLFAGGGEPSSALLECIAQGLRARLEVLDGGLLMRPMVKKAEFLRLLDGLITLRLFRTPPAL